MISMRQLTIILQQLHTQSKLGWDMLVATDYRSMECGFNPIRTASLFKDFIS